MDTLHTVLRSIRGETKSPRDHHNVFREFLDHLGRITRSREIRPAPSRDSAPGSGKSVRRSRRS